MVRPSSHRPGKSVRQGNGSRARRSDPVRDQHRLVVADDVRTYCRRRRAHHSALDIRSGALLPLPRRRHAAALASKGRLIRCTVLGSMPNRAAILRTLSPVSLRAVRAALGSLTDPQDQNIRRSGGLQQKQSPPLTGASFRPPGDLSRRKVSAQKGHVNGSAW